MPTKTRKLSATEERLMEIQEQLGKWNGFVRELPVPNDIAPAIMTGRIELIGLAQPRALSAEECATLYSLIGGLLETNLVLQEHASLVSRMASDVRAHIAGAEGTILRMESYANFRMPQESDDDEA